jgi:hypothetical protein
MKGKLKRFNAEDAKDYAEDAKAELLPLSPIFLL